MASVWVSGIAGGFLASAVMGAVMRTVMREEPLPTELFASRFINDRPPIENRYWGLLLHLTYGTTVGVVFVLLLEAFVRPLTVIELLPAVGYGVVWGFVLWGVSFFWLSIVGTFDEADDMDPDARLVELTIILANHVLYGIVLAGTARAYALAF